MLLYTYIWSADIVRCCCCLSAPRASVLKCNKTSIKLYIIIGFHLHFFLRLSVCYTIITTAKNICKRFAILSASAALGFWYAIIIQYQFVFLFLSIHTYMQSKAIAAFDCLLIWEAQPHTHIIVAEKSYLDFIFTLNSVTNLPYVPTYLKPTSMLRRKKNVSNRKLKKMLPSC